MSYLTQDNKTEDKPKKIRKQQISQYGSRVKYPESVIDGYLDKNEVPKWFRGYSSFQIQAASNLQHAIRDDIEQNTTQRVRHCLASIGLEPLGSSKELKFLMRLSGGNDLAFLWFLMELRFRTPGEKYSLNEQLIMSTIAHLDMVFTLRELDRILPPGHPNKEEMKRTEQLQRKREKEERERNRVKKERKYILPYFDRLIRPKHFGKPLSAKPPDYTVLFRLYHVHADPNYVIQNSENRWFALYDVSEGRRIAHQIINQCVNEMFEDLDGARERAKGIKSICVYHKKLAEKERLKSFQTRLLIKERFLQLLDVDRYEREKRKKKVMEDFEKEICKYLCQIAKPPPAGQKCVARKSENECDYDFIVENVEDISTGCTNEEECDYECTEHTTSKSDDDCSSRLSGGGGPIGNCSKPYRNICQKNKSHSSSSNCNRTARTQRESELDAATAAFFDQYFQMNNCAKLKSGVPNGKRRRRKDYCCSGDTNTEEELSFDDEEQSYHDICSSDQYSCTSNYRKYDKSAGLRLKYNPQAIDDYMDCKEKEIYDLLSFKKDLAKKKKDKDICTKKDWKPCFFKNEYEVPICDHKIIKKKKVETSTDSTISSSSKATCIDEYPKSGYDFIHILKGPAPLKSSSHSSQQTVSSENYVNQAHTVKSSIKCALKASETYFKAPTDHTPYNFNYFNIFKMDKPTSEEKQKEKEKARRFDVGDIKSPTDITHIIAEVLRNKPDSIHKRYNFNDSSDGEQEKVCHDYENESEESKSELEYPLNLNKIARKVADQIWKREVEKYTDEEDDIPKDQDYNSPLSKKYPKKFYDCDDKKLMYAMLKDALEYMRQDNRFVLAGMPESHNLPFLREWIQKRYGKVYTEQQRKEAYRQSMVLFKALDKLPIKVTMPNIKEIGKELFVSYNCRDYLIKKTQIIKKKYYDQLDTVIMEHARIFWYAIRPYLCSTGPPRNTYFAYMPSKLKDITRLRPWRPGEFNDCKAARERRKRRV